MTTDTATSLTDTLEHVISQEREAILDGRLDLISDYHAEKEKLIEAIGELATLDETRLSDIQKKLERNQELICSAMEGLRSVSQRLAELRGVREGLQTYDSDGKRRSHRAGHRPTLEKRA